MPVASVIEAATASMRKSSGGISAIGSAVGTSRTTIGAATTANSTPRTPPAPASNRLSVSICRTRRSRLAPTAVLTASSVCRASARDHSRLARLVHAINNTHSDAPTMAHNSIRGLPGHLVTPSLQVDVLAGLLPGKLLRDLIANGPQFRSRLFEADTGLEPRHHLEIVIAAAVDPTRCC